MPARTLKRPVEAGSLLLATQQLLHDSHRTHEEIFLATGLPMQWLSSLVRGQTPDPSVNRVQKLYEFLSGKELKV